VEKGAYERINTQGSVTASNVQYTSNEYPEGVEVSAATLQFSPQQASLSDAKARFKKTNLTASGSLQNIIGYALNKGELGGTLHLTADKIMLNDWMQLDTATAGTAPDVFLVPANMNIAIHAKADEVVYDKVSYRNVQGTLQLNNETVKLQNVATEALDGNIVFNGGYSTRNSKTAPDINLDYNITNVDVQKAFFAFNTVQKLMPLGKFLSGKLSSQFSMAGKLNGQMFPELSSLTGNGNLLLIQGVLSKFKPMEKIASTLNVTALQDISLKDIKSYFEFANGKVLVKPFNLKVSDIEMQVGGMHGFDQSMDYIIGMKVPRKYMGAAGNNLVNSLAAQATAKGIPLQLGDVVDLNVKLGGTLSNPTVKTDLKQTAGDMGSALKQQAASFVQQKADSAKQSLKDSLNVMKKQVGAEVKNELFKQLSGNKDTTAKTDPAPNVKEKATETLKNTFNGLFKKKKPERDSTGN
jgi:hypothetical protein